MSFLYVLLGGVGIGIGLLHQHILINHKEQYINVFTEIAWNILYYCSKCQLYYMQFTKKVKDFIHPFLNISSKKTDNVIFYKNGIVSTVDNYDLVVYDSANSGHKATYSIMPINPDIEESDIQFISITLFMLDKNVAIKLKTPDYNYYVVNNKINKAFVQYYANVVLKENILPEITYSMVIMDHNVNIVELNEKKELVFTKTSYTISDIITDTN